MIIPPLDLLEAGLLITVWLAVEMWEVMGERVRVFRGQSSDPDLDAILHICVMCDHAKEDHYKKIGRCTRADVGCQCARFRGR